MQLPAPINNYILLWLLLSSTCPIFLLLRRMLPIFAACLKAGLSDRHRIEAAFRPIPQQKHQNPSCRNPLKAGGFYNFVRLSDQAAASSY